MVKRIKDYIKNINAVIGCNIGCPYCYAKMLTNRFGLSSDFTKPIYAKQKFKKIRKNGVYFLTGMSDPSVWNDEWLESSFVELKNNPNAIGIYLTKKPEKVSAIKIPDNAWFGVTVTCKNDIKRIESLKTLIKCRHYHVTFEPLFENIGFVDLRGIDWIVIGTETGNRKNKAVTKIDWINNIVEQARRDGCKIFMKEDLFNGILDEDEAIQEFPQDFYTAFANK